MLARLLFGLIAGAIGALIVVMLVWNDGPRTHLTWAVIQLCAFAWVGAVLLGFALSQLLQVAYVREDCPVDLQRWVAMTIPERERWQRRSDAAERLSASLFVWLVAGLTLILDIRLSKALWQAGPGSAAVWVMLGANAAAVWLLVVWRRRPGRHGNWQQVGPGHWRVRVDVDAPARENAVYGLVLSLLLSLFGGTMVIKAGDPADAVFPGVLIMASAAFALWAAWTLWSLRGPRMRHLELEVVRSSADPDAMDCQITLPTPVNRRFATKDWQARLTAEKLGRYMHERWLDSVVPAQVPPGTTLLDFRLRVSLPPEIPEGPFIWTLHLERRRSRKVIHAVGLPQQVVFPGSMQPATRASAPVLESAL
ncbi:hypothetical protein [Ramlibacter sp.]|uniref:hypothetical protein n=1 Tax=Ramlibacter sp. TaxID=1917967 RepID=UPI0035B23C1D